MGEVSRRQGLDIKKSLIDSVLAGLCALIVFGPIVGIVLKGYSFELSTRRVAVIVRGGDGGEAAAEPAAAKPQWTQIYRPFLKGPMTACTFVRSAIARGCAG
ncbi:Domain of uncharacterised function (DUF3382) [Raoultella terrigena]|uniref:Domain of uncharacterized function (DUF3382) n=1 Tax=Raoultella terrigena TaxID=577 RepID=A0A4U9CW83_RAOTE|nr:Domain of uncharacterised function (DUF3382) [Raoultella terrigena]